MYSCFRFCWELLICYPGLWQGFYWNNSQATIHPFVLYYVDPEKETVCHEAFSCISNHMTHDIVAVHTFLQVLIKDHIKLRYPFIKKIIYFRDVSAIQYKNYKNFSNLLHHESDFSIKAGWHFLLPCMVKMHVMVLVVLLKGLLHVQVFRCQSLIKF